MHGFSVDLQGLPLDVLASTRTWSQLILWWPADGMQAMALLHSVGIDSSTHAADVCILASWLDLEGSQSSQVCALLGAFECVHGWWGLKACSSSVCFP